MQSIIKAVAAVAIVVVPAVSFAQSQQPLTRAQVRDEYVQLRSEGYVPQDRYYPEHFQSAQARIDSDKGTTAYGAGTNTTSQSGQ